jgi:TonB family protein
MVVFGKPVRDPYGDHDLSARLLPVEEGAFVGSPEKAENGQPAAFWTHVPLLQFDPQDLPAFLLDAKDKPPPRSKSRPPPIDFARRASLEAERQTLLAKADEIEIMPPHEPPVILETGSLQAPIKAFEECDRDLLHDLGLDPDIQDKIARPLWVPDITRWIGPSDYPRNRLIMGQESQLSMRLIVDASGKVTKCTALSDFNAPEFNQAVCDALSRAVFEPAELADGAKVPSYYTATVVFRMGN